MKTEKIKELKRGCGKEIQVNINGRLYIFECGKWQEISNYPNALHSKMEWCESCKSKIKQAHEDKELFDHFIKCEINFLNELTFNECEKGTEREMVNKRIKELKDLVEVEDKK